NNLQYFSKKQNIKLPEINLFNNSIYRKGIFNTKISDIDCVINCCHGGVGENGDLAGFFESMGIRYTSANSLASHIAMDKSLAKTILRDIVPTIQGVKITKENIDDMIKKVEEEFTENLIVKPNSLGSSIGVKACNKDNYKNQIQAIFEMNDDVLVEKRIVNIREYNQACIKTKEGLLLSAIEEPIYKSDILSFDEKYESKSKLKGQDRIIPAKIDKELVEKINTMTKGIYSTLNMNGVVRIDYIFDADSNEIYFNEINTIPGSMAYYLFEPIGVDYISLMDMLIDNVTTPKKYSYFDTKVLDNKSI
ncbi:MAG: hypothetical protein ACLRFL_00865, partial [Clostridia bacterium]